MSKSLHEASTTVHDVVLHFAQSLCISAVLTSKTVRFWDRAQHIPFDRKYLHLKIITTIPGKISSTMEYSIIVENHAGVPTGNQSTTYKTKAVPTLY